MKVVKNGHCSLGICENEFFKGEMKKIMSELGEKGWAAIHYAIFRGDESII